MTIRSPRGVLSTLATLLLLVLPLLPGCSQRGPDVLVIVIDTLRADHLAVYGYDRDTAPNLTRLARDGVVYESAISPATWTVPAHASILTGRWPSYHGAERVPGDRLLAMPVSPDVAMLPEILRERGYRTGAFIGNSTYLAPLFGFQRGFDDFVTGNFWHAIDVVDPLTAWLREGRRPAFLLWNVIDPHEPYDPPKPFDEKFPGRRPEHGTMLTELSRNGPPITPEALAHFVSQYDGEILAADEAIGKVLDLLRQQRRYDGALIIVTADHGEMFGEHGAYGHGGTPFEPLVRVPLIVKYPGNRDAGARVERRVSTLAIFGTVLRELGVPDRGQEDSASLDREHAVWVEDVDSLGGRVLVGYDGPHKLVSRKTDATQDIVLYDLSHDPGESAPIRAADAQPSLRSALAAFAAAPRPTNRANVPVIDAEHEAKLRALGYVR